MIKTYYFNIHHSVKNYIVRYWNLYFFIFFFIILFLMSEEMLCDEGNLNNSEKIEENKKEQSDNEWFIEQVKNGSTDLKESGYTKDTSVVANMATSIQNLISAYPITIGTIIGLSCAFMANKLINDPNDPNFIGIRNTIILAYQFLHGHWETVSGFLYAMLKPVINYVSYEYVYHPVSWWCKTGVVLILPYGILTGICIGRFVEYYYGTGPTCDFESEIHRLDELWK